MIQNLIILGLLKKNPSSGYDIKKFISQELGIFSKPETQSIYYPLRKMEKEGLIKKKEPKSSKHIKKYLYSITPKGEKIFLSLCKQAFLSQRRPFIELDIALYFLPFLDKKEIMPLLRLRLRFLEKVKEWLIEKKEELKRSPRNLTLLLDHHYKLALAEKAFLKDVIFSVKSGQNV
ncbi:MAG: PadR family transcriptional regulator [Candidatus Omnitrophica bacterium]|nr:PadR family transcriptional regulator [Candidatus Omnitrophota bacterium]